jgi:transposase
MYAIDRRQLAAHIYSLVQSLRKTAILLQVSHTTIARWLKQPERKQYVRQSRKHNKVIECIKGCITSNPLITTNEVRTILKQVCDVSVSTELVRIAIRRLGFSRKRVRFYGDPPDLFAVTHTFLKKRQLFIDQKRRFVSIDETAFGRSCPSIHGYSPIGKRLFVRKTVPRITTVSYACCATSDGSFYTSAPAASFNTTRFCSFIEQLPLKSNDVVLLDNVRFHHTKTVRDSFYSRGVEVLFVPPYSPWYNPIELCFSVIKRAYYKVRDVDFAFQVLQGRSDVIESFFLKSLGTSCPF